MRLRNVVYDHLRNRILTREAQEDQSSRKRYPYPEYAKSYIVMPDPQDMGQVEVAMFCIGPSHRVCVNTHS